MFDSKAERDHYNSVMVNIFLDRPEFEMETQKTFYNAQNIDQLILIHQRIGRKIFVTYKGTLVRQTRGFLSPDKIRKDQVEALLELEDENNLFNYWWFASAVVEKKLVLRLKNYKNVLLCGINYQSKMSLVQVLEWLRREKETISEIEAKGEIFDARNIHKYNFPRDDLVFPPNFVNSNLRSFLRTLVAEGFHLFGPMAPISHFVRECVRRFFDLELYKAIGFDSGEVCIQEVSRDDYQNILRYLKTDDKRYTFLLDNRKFTYPWFISDSVEINDPTGVIRAPDEFVVFDLKNPDRVKINLENRLIQRHCLLKYVFRYKELPPVPGSIFTGELERQGEDWPEMDEEKWENILTQFCKKNFRNPEEWKNRIEAYLNA